MTQIRIRHDNEPVGAILGDVPFLNIDSVIRLLKLWGVKDRVEETFLNRDGFCGEFVYDTESNEAYFEVTVE